MEFKKVTISLPKTLYNQSMGLVKKGLFSNLSDLVRSGIRNEFKEIEPLMRNLIYDDKELITGVKQSMKEARQGKGKVLKSDKEMDKYFEAL